MDETIAKYLTALQIDLKTPDLAIEAKDYLQSKSIDFLSENREDVAALFYQVLCTFQRTCKGKIGEEIEKETISLFEHIAQLSTDLENQSKDSNLMTIWFLNELYQKARISKETAIDMDGLKEDIGNLIAGLGDIRYVFKIKQNGEKAFPINRLIVRVLKDDEFSSMKAITLYHIKMFQLAVELFHEENEKEVINKLVDECNLKFLDYLDGTHKIIDTKDFLNYQKNGVMIFYNGSKNSVLIRHEKKSYFKTDEPKWEEYVGVEVNAQKDVIGHYVIIEDLKNIELLDFSALMKKNPTTALELIYDKGFYNIFCENSLYLLGDEIYPINKYSVNDKYIIEGFLDRQGKVYKKDKLNTVIQGYKMVGIKRNALNQVSFGLCQCLLEKNNIGVEQLGLNSLSNGEWYQNQVLKNWVNANSNIKEALEFVLKKLILDLEYCKNNLVYHNIKETDLLPYSLDFGWVYNILNIPQEKKSIYVGVVAGNGEGSHCLYINNIKTMAGKSNPQKECLNLEELVFYSELSELEKEEYNTEGVEHYVVFDDSQDRWYGSIEDEILYRYIVQLELIMDRNSLDAELCNIITINQFKDIKGYMELHKDALMAEDAGEKVFLDFDSMVVYRLVHNLIWNKISKDKWNSFYKIIMHHQKLKFSDIADDIVFQRKEENALYVPKDNSGSDGTLCRTYFEYLVDKTKRERNSIYSPKITFDEGESKYKIREKVIEKIVFLFDNICSGTGSCNALAFYLNKEELVSSGWDESKKTIMRMSQQKYQVNDEIVPVHKIIEMNKITEINVHSYYGTEAGVRRIESLLEKCAYDNVKVDYKHKITKYYMQIADEVKKIWSETPDTTRDYCTFIREFNQPKKNVFPSKMLEDAGKSICLFVKKSEQN